MPDKVMPGPVGDSCGIREAVCIHTRKIYDSCRDKDCIEVLRFYPKLPCVDVINRALSVKGGSAKLLYVYVDVEPVSFNRGFYTVDNEKRCKEWRISKQHWNGCGNFIGKRTSI